MKQTIFETRQRAEELIHEAINIWRQSDMNDSLEGLEKDPVFSLLMTALAYQMNELVTDMEAMKIEKRAFLSWMSIPRVCSAWKVRLLPLSLCYGRVSSMRRYVPLSDWMAVVGRCPWYSNRPSAICRASLLP